MSTHTTTPTDFRIEGKGHVTSTELDHVREMLEKVVQVVDEPVLSARALLAHRSSNSIDHRWEALASLNTRGDAIRAHTFKPTATEAVDSLRDKLRSQLRRRANRRRSESIRKATEEGTWRHGSRPSDRPEFLDRPVDDRELVRHKTFATPTSTVEEALWDMVQLDYDFFLFVDEKSGADSVVSISREDDEPVVKSRTDAPELSVDAALDWLTNSSEPYVFFTDEESGRGCVVYRRYDGHYGLLTPR